MALAGGFRQEDFETAIGRQLDEAQGAAFWGIAALAVGDAPASVYARGRANDTTEISIDTLFEISSVSKQFTAAAILVLEMRGAVSLSDPLQAFFPGAPADKANIRLQDLLAHTSGFDADFGLPYDSPAGRDAFLDEVLARPLTAPVGRRFEYANTNYSVLAAVVEVVVGETFEDFARTALFGPAGLGSTGFVGDENLIGSAMDCVRRSGRRREGTAADWHYSWGYRGMGGVVSTARDLLAWDRALRGETILSAAAKASMFRSGKGGYGLGWFVEPTGRGTHKAWHDGSVCGFEALFMRYLEEDAALVVLSNEEADVDLFGRTLDDVMFDKPRLTISTIRSPLLGLQAVRAGGDALPVTAVIADGTAILQFQSEPVDGAIPAVSMPAGYASRVAFELARCLEVLPPSTGGNPQAAMLSEAAATSSLAGDGTGVASGEWEIIVYPAREYRPPGGSRRPRLDMVVCVEDADFTPLLAFELDAAAAHALIGQLEAGGLVA